MAKEQAELLLVIKQTGLSALNKIKSGLSNIASVAKVALGGLIAGTTASLVAYRGQEKAINSLNQSLINQGIYTKELSADYQKQAAELQKLTTFGDEQIIQAQSLIQGYVGQEKVTKELTQSILDFATAQKMDVTQAAGLVGKAIGTNTNALTRYGIEIDTGASKSEKMAQAIAGLSGQFGGQAQAAAKGLGTTIQLKNAFGDVLEVIGKQLSPVISGLAGKLTVLSEKLQTNAGFAAKVKDVFQNIGNVGIVVKNVMFGIAEVIGSVLGTALGAVTQMISGNFAQAWETAKSISSDSLTQINERIALSHEEIAELDAMFLEQKANHHAQENAMLAQAAAQKDMIRNNDLVKETAKEKKTTKMKAEEFKKRRKEQQTFDKEMIKWENQTYEGRMQMMSGFMNRISVLQESKNKNMVAIGRAAAASAIIMDTAMAIMKSFAFLGPIAGAPFAAAMGAAGAVQLGKVYGVKLAEGGIVTSREGGVSARIGEGGRDEAVIPLEDGAAGMGSNISINVGAFLGNEEEAREFAIKIDEELFKLRRTNESLSFDTQVV